MKKTKRVKQSKSVKFPFAFGTAKKTAKKVVAFDLLRERSRHRKALERIKRKEKNTIKKLNRMAKNKK